MPLTAAAIGQATAALTGYSGAAHSVQPPFSVNLQLPVSVSGID